MLDKGAVTRMNNTIKQGKRNQMAGPGAQAAQASLKNQVKRDPVKPQAPVGPNYSDVVTPQPPPNIPTGGPELPPQQEEFDAGIFKQDMMDHIVGQARTTNFLNSAAAKDAQTSVQLKEIFNQFNPNKRPDPRSLVDRVVNRMGINPNEQR